MKRLSALVGSLVLVALVASPAAAASQLGLSSDGVTFTDHISTPLFDPSFIWVPGDSQSETFYVRNQGGGPAVLTVDLLGSHIGQMLDTGDVHVSANAAGADTAVASDGSEQRLLTLNHVADGQIVPVTVTASFDFSAPNATQLQSTDLNFRVYLTQTGTASIASTDVSSQLPDTGAPNITWIAALGAILLGTGLAIVSRRYLQHQGESHV